MASKRAIIRQLQDAVADLEARLAQAQGLAQQAFERQVLIACLLERLATDGACILPIELRQQALDESWGYETMIVETEKDNPMIVRILKTAHRPNLKLPGVPRG